MQVMTGSESEAELTSRRFLTPVHPVKAIRQGQAVTEQ